MALDLPSLYPAHLDALDRAYARALDAHGFDALVIHSGAALRQSRFDDQYWPHKPTPYFAHFCPLVEPDAFVVVRPGNRPTLYRTTESSFWDSPAPTASNHFWASFDVIVDRIDKVKTSLPASARTAFVGENAEVAAALGFDSMAPCPAGLLAELDVIRAHKSDYERECIREANRIAMRGHRAVAERFAAEDLSELELHLAYLRETQQDATQTPYGNIVALGQHAAVLHHVHYGTLREGARSLLVDAGALCLGYAADITRTHSKGSGGAAGVFATLIERIDSMQRELCASLLPGLLYEDLHDQSHLALANILRDLEIVEADAEAMVATGVTRAFFPHGLGHSLGLQVHDVGCKPNPPRDNNPFLRTTTVVEEGHVFTIEPGCYFIPSLLDGLRGSPESAHVCWSLVEELRDFGGIRIEDNVAVTASGTVNLTRDNGAGQP